jgi:hypothetical protein
MKPVPMGELVWPYRPDLLIRIDFLEWWRSARPALWPDAPEHLDGAAVEAHEPFFAEARRHPYFVQFTRKKRYRHRELTMDRARPIYAQGVAAFLNLIASIERRGYDPGAAIGLRRSVFQRSSGFGAQQRRRWFIRDGCHRFACLAWLGRGEPLPPHYFAIERRLVHRPLDWRAVFSRLGVLGERELGAFDALFSSPAAPPWEAVLEWSERVRDHFRTLDVESMFARPAAGGDEGPREDRR